MYIRIPLLCALHCCCQLGQGWRQDPPTAGYAVASKDIPSESKRRKQESLRLKPPPEDWPSPTMGAADFLYEPEVTISPLQAYQAKLQEEYLKDMRRQSQNRRKEEPQRVTEPPSEWTSSDEEFKKLLDPNELLKLNKKLAPLLNEQNKITSKLKKILTTERSDLEESSHKIRRSEMGTTTDSPHWMRNNNKVKTPDDSSSRFEQRKTRVKKLKRKRKVRRKLADENTKTKKRRVKAKKFAFDVHRSSEGGSSASFKIKVDSRSEKTGDSLSKLASGGSASSESSDSSEEEPPVTAKHSLTNVTTTEKGRTTQKTSIVKTTTLTNVENLYTSKTEDIFMETSPLPVLNQPPRTEGSKNERSAAARKMEVREKRKRIRQEMEKVLIEEQLDGSFGDRDSTWTTSEEEFYVEYTEIRKSADRKIEALKKIRTTLPPVNVTTTKLPIINVTPREAILGILKHKIVAFLDNVLKPKTKEEMNS